MFSKSMKSIYIKISGQKIFQYTLNALGLANRDLPLDKSEDSRFLMILIALMSFLAVLALSGNLTLNNMVQRWSSGLENKVTIEIPVETNTGDILSQRTIEKETKKIKEELRSHPNIKTIEILSSEDIQSLLAPWIGNGLTLDEVPLPGLLSVQLNASDKEEVGILKADLYRISKYANLETHHEWLGDIINFTSTLKAIALLITALITGITITAIMAGMRARLAIHRKEVELLHYMGATDTYIVRQFQRHATMISISGALIGTACGLVVISIITALSINNNSSALIPTLEFEFLAALSILSIPIAVCVIAIITSRYTVLRDLSKMP